MYPKGVANLEEQIAPVPKVGFVIVLRDEGNTPFVLVNNYVIHSTVQSAVPVVVYLVLKSVEHW